MKMKGPSRGTTLAAAFGLLLPSVLFALDLSDHARARAAELSALTALPDATFAIAGLSVLLLAALAFAIGLVRALPDAWKGYRLLPIAAVTLVFLDLFVVGPPAPPVSSAERLELAFGALVERASAHAAAHGVVPTPAELEGLLQTLGQPPFLVRGVRPERFLLHAEEGCEDALRALPSATAPTFLYCRSRDGRRGFLSAVALPHELRFGPVQPFTREGRLVAATIPQGPGEEGPPEAPAPAAGPPRDAQ